MICLMMYLCRTFAQSAYIYTHNSTQELQQTLKLIYLSLSLSSSSLAMAKDLEVQEGRAARDYQDPPPAPLFDMEELGKWSLYRAVIAEFVATLLFLYVSILTVIGYKAQTDASAGGADCGGVGILGIAWAFGGMIFVLVYCTAGISGTYTNAPVTVHRLSHNK